MRYANNIGPQIRRRRYALGWSQSTFAAKLQLAGLDISRSGVSKMEARLRFVDDKDLMFLRSAESPRPGTLPAPRRRRASMRLHGEARDDTVLTDARPRPVAP